MRDYPTIIKDLKISKRMDEIADHLKDCGLILKGTIIPEDDRVIFLQSNNQTAEYNNIEHNAYDFLASRQKDNLCEVERSVVTEMFKLQEDKGRDLQMSGTVAAMTSLLVLYCSNLTSAIGPLLLAGVGYCGSVVNLSTLLKVHKLDSLMQLDEWFANNLKEVNERFGVDQPDFKKLSRKSQEIIKQPDIAGKISLNNIQNFPVGDLKLMRRTIQKEENKAKKEREKSLRKIKRGM